MSRPNLSSRENKTGGLDFKYDPSVDYIDLLVNSQVATNDGIYYNDKLSASYMVATSELMEFEIPNTVYLINSTNNNFDYKIGAGAMTTFTPPPGCYTLPSLLSSLATGTTLTFVFSNDTQKVTISNGAAFSFFPSTGPNASTSIASVLGFTPVDITGVTTTTGTNAVSVTLLYLNLSILEMGKNKCISTKGIPSTYRLSIAADSGSIVMRALNNSYKQIVRMPGDSRTDTGVPLSKLTYQLTFSDGTIATLNGTNFSFVLRLSSKQILS